MSSRSHSVSSSPFSVHIKDQHNAPPAHLTLKLSANTELILTGRHMSPAGNSCLRLFFFFFKVPSLENKLVQWTCQFRLEPGRIHPERQDRPILVTWSSVGIFQSFEMSFEMTSGKSHWTMKQSNGLFDQNLIGLFSEFSKKQQLLLQWLQANWLHVVVNCISSKRQRWLLLISISEKILPRFSSYFILMKAKYHKAS